MHLTNYSLNKKNEDYQFIQDDENEIGSTGSKRTFSYVMRLLKKKGKNTQEIWQNIKYLTQILLISIHPFILFEQDCLFSDSKKKVKNGFHLIGIDILLDARCKPWLLEINGNPSMNMEHLIDPEDENSESVISPIDKFIKEKAMEGCLELVLMPKKKQQ